MISAYIAGVLSLLLWTPVWLRMTRNWGGICSFFHKKSCGTTKSWGKTADNAALSCQSESCRESQYNARYVMQKSPIHVKNSICSKWQSKLLMTSFWCLIFGACIIPGLVMRPCKHCVHMHALYKPLKSDTPTLFTHLHNVSRNNSVPLMCSNFKCTNRKINTSLVDITTPKSTAQ